MREEQRQEALRREVSLSEEATLPPTPKPVAPPRVEEPRIDSKALLETAGLVMIETDRAKASPQAPVEEPQQLGRPRRERPTPAPKEEPPLVQIETRK